MPDFDPKAPTRQDLAKFLPDQRAIRAFEQLFALVPSQFNLTEEQIIEINTALNIADARATQAIGSLVDIERRAKSNEVLTWLSM